jgi:hypothetical protein
MVSAGDWEGKAMTEFLRGRLGRVEPAKPGWSDHLPLPCNAEIQAKLLTNFVEEAGPLETKCWIWQGTMDGSNGYGRVKYRGSPYGAHRLAYRNLVGPFDEEMLICHHCDVPACIRPEHLYVGTQKENVNDREERVAGLIGGASTTEGQSLLKPTLSKSWS